MAEFQLWQGDCLDLMQFLPSGSVDLILTDPPYGDTSLQWDRKVAHWPREALRLLRPSGSMWVFGSFRYFADAFRTDLFAGWQIAQDVVWEKHNGSSFHADRFKRVHELAAHLYPLTSTWGAIYRQPQFTADATARAMRRKKRPPHAGHIEASSYVSQDGGPRLMRSVIYARSCHGYAQHPTQKPEDIVTPLLEFACPPGGDALDMFMGSGTTGVACANTGRNFIGIERDEKYFKIAQERVEAAYSAKVAVGLFD